MGEGIHGSKRPARWLVWAAAGLLVGGVAWAGSLSTGGSDTGQRIVTAAGRSTGGVELPPPVTPPVAPPAPPVVPTTSAPTTTAAVVTTAVPKPAVTVRAPVPTTVRTAVTTEPVRPATTSTTGASASRAKVTVANDAAHAFVVTVNGRTFELAPGQQAGPVDIELYAHGNDIVDVHAVADPTCGLGDADNYFDAGGRYRLAVVPGPGMCRTMPGPRLEVTPA